MKTLKRELTVLSLALALFTTSSALPILAISLGLKLAAASTHEGSERRKLRVLFIGNSYTYVNNLPEIVAGLAESAHESLETEMIVAPGATLQRHWEDGKAVQAMKRSHWDYVVLQEQSTLGFVPQDGPPINDPKTFHQYARMFNAEIKSAGAKTVFLLTWARKNLPETQSHLTNAYFSIARELDAIVAPVGLAWEAALKKNPSLALHQTDLSHPTPAGSYLAACVLYSTLYGRTSAGLTGRVIGNTVDVSGRVLENNGQTGNSGHAKGELVNLTTPDSTLLQQVAWQTVRGQKSAGKTTGL